MLAGVGSFVGGAAGDGETAANGVFSAAVVGVSSFDDGFLYVDS